ncbi:MAG: hypothetical protein HYV28_08960 [Ignavibacteriales bacterium]|nr:hypothetical protein [Ignavibacteriales bacterium]
MELIPILATIILMATISTFFLAIGAYVLYKIREKRGVKSVKAAPATIQAELITPEVLAEQAKQTIEQVAKSPIRAFERPNPPAYRPAPEPIFMPKRVTQPIAAPAQQQQQRFVASQQEMPKAGPSQVQGQAADQKFLKVTSEGYVTPKEEKKQGGQVKWR